MRPSRLTKPLCQSEGQFDCQLSQGRSPNTRDSALGRTSMSVKIRTTVCGAVIAAVGIAAALPASAATPQPRATLDAAPTWTAKASAASGRQRQPAAAHVRHPQAAQPGRRRGARPGRQHSRQQELPQVRQRGGLAQPVRPDRRHRQLGEVLAERQRLHHRRHPGQPPHRCLHRHRRPGREGVRHHAEDLRQGRRRPWSPRRPRPPSRRSIAGSVAGVTGLDTSLRATPDNTGGPAYKAIGRLLRPRPRRPTTCRPRRWSSSTPRRARPTTARSWPPASRRSRASTR